MAATINDISKIVGVSNMAVSLAFKGSPRVSKETRERILAVAKELNYVPNQTARSLRSGRSNTVGFIVCDITNPFYGLVLEQSEIMFNRHGMEIFFGSNSWDSEREKALIKKMIQMRVRGVLICTASRNGDSFKLLDEAGIPYVLTDSAPEFYHGPAVLNDLRKCAQLAAGHFLDIGVRRPGLVNALEKFPNCSAFEQLEKSFREYLTKHKIKIDARNYVSGGVSIEAGAAAYRQLRRQRSDADGIFCINDLCALGLMDEAGRHGQVAGRDFALAGVDDLNISALSRIGLTSVRQPYAELAKAAAELLYALIQGEEKENRRIMLEPTLSIRETTRLFQAK